MTSIEGMDVCMLLYTKNQPTPHPLQSTPPKAGTGTRDRYIIKQASKTTSQPANQPTDQVIQPAPGLLDKNQQTPAQLDQRQGGHKRIAHEWTSLTRTRARTRARARMKMRIVNHHPSHSHSPRRGIPPLPFQWVGGARL